MRDDRIFDIILNQRGGALTYESDGGPGWLRYASGFCSFSPPGCCENFQCLYLELMIDLNAARGRGSVFFPRLCDMLCASGFVDNANATKAARFR